MQLSKKESACLTWAAPSLLVEAHTLVAMMACARCPRKVSPSTCSAAPYIGDESKKFASALSAASTIVRAFFSAGSLDTSNVLHVPIPATGTDNAVLPNLRLSIQSY